jgi:hypothetical protein
MVLLMHVVLREARKKDMPLLEKFNAETGWKGIPESQRTLLNREKWNRHMVEVFEDSTKEKTAGYLSQRMKYKRLSDTYLLGKAAIC